MFSINIQTARFPYPSTTLNWQETGSLLLAVQMRIGWVSVSLCVAPHSLDAATRPCCACAALQAEPKEIPEAVQAFFAIPLEPAVHPSFRLHEICYRLINVLLAHTNHVYGKNPSPYSGILFSPVRFFEIVFICPSHSTSGIDGSSKLSVRGLKFGANFCVQLRLHPYITRKKTERTWHSWRSGKTLFIFGDLACMGALVNSGDLYRPLFKSVL